MAQYKQASANSQTKIGAGKLIGIFVSAASGSPTMVAYDSKNANTGDPKILDTFTPVAGTMYYFGPNGMFFNNGLYIVIANTVSWTTIFE